MSAPESPNRRSSVGRAGPLHRVLSWIGLLALAAGQLGSATPARAAPSGQTDFPNPQAAVLLEQLTPAERIGQLFLVSFDGAQLDPDSPIYDLIVNRHIGGVVLSRTNDNFIGPEGTLSAAQDLVGQLQQTEWDASQPGPAGSAGSDPALPSYIPLFVGISQEGNGYPSDQILNGLTSQPNLLAIGATWRPELARQAGTVLGEELGALGVNLLLGPSLDVLDNSTPNTPQDLGPRSFGGDPYWVGVMGRAYISGVHDGSQGTIAVVGKHFPGLGGSDRLPTEDVATVRKSLEQLKQIELAPFFAVTGDAPTESATVDALLNSHIRYQGFQGNIRATTSPISFDPQAFELLMSLDPLASWRESGGVVISDELGSRAVRRFFETSGQTFDPRSVARNALLAGNDLLYLGDIVTDESLDRYTTTIRILDFFTQKYQEDPAFKQRVDQSVMRLLTLKLRLFGEFSLENVLPDPRDLEGLARDRSVTFNIASRAATLISPAASELDSVLPNPPELNDRFVIFTDTYNVSQCSTCPEQAVLGVEAFQQSVINLYGPQAGALTRPEFLPSFSTTTLTGVLDAGPGDTLLERVTRQADWIIFAILDEDPNRPASLALRRFLDERPDLFRQKKLIVFAFDAPYYLDATDIVKLTAYFGLYSATPEFLETAARILYRELRPIPGALPVSVPGVGYDLISATSPDPEQPITLLIDTPEAEGGQVTGTPEPLLGQDLQVGDVISVRTAVIVDYNGNPVPDNTPVQFILSIGGLERPPQVETTVNGTSRTSFVINAPGPLTILARSGDPPAISNPIQLEIPGENGGTQEPTLTATATETPTEVPTATESAPEIAETPIPPAPRTRTDFADWLLALSVALLAGWASFRLSVNAGHIRWGMRLGMAVLIGGLLAYIYLSLQLPGTAALLEAAGRAGVLVATLLGAALGFGGGWTWRAWRKRAGS